ncbi:MAG: hypothetical protein F6K56_23755 [Moorea sp. SIO3G5]|nr:hypothetical protein [Moorena sp. SIO3G5]
MATRFAAKRDFVHRVQPPNLGRLATRFAAKRDFVHRVQPTLLKGQRRTTLANRPRDHVQPSTS